MNDAMTDEGLKDYDDVERDQCRRAVKPTGATYRDSIETLVKVLRAHENGDQPFIGDAADALEASVPRSMYDALVKQSKDYAAQADAEIKRLWALIHPIRMAVAAYKRSDQSVADCVHLSDAVREVIG